MNIASLQTMIIGLYVTLPVITIFCIYWFYIRIGKVTLILTEPIGDTGLRRILKKIKRIPISIQKKEYKGNTYIIDLEKAVLDEHNRPQLWYNYSDSEPISIDNKNNGIKTEKPINFKDNEKVKPSKALSLVLKNNSAEKILHGSMEKKYIIIILILVVAIVAVAGYGMFSINQSNTQLFKLLNSTKLDTGVIVK